MLELKKQLNNQSWLTENTEIFTDIGYIPIWNISKVTTLLTLNPNYQEGDDIYVPTKLLRFSKFDFKGRIKTRKSFPCFQGRLILPQNKMINHYSISEIPVLRNQSYQGELFHIETDSNTLLIRNVFEDTGEQFLILCVK